MSGRPQTTAKSEPSLLCDVLQDSPVVSMPCRAMMAQCRARLPDTRDVWSVAWARHLHSSIGGTATPFEQDIDLTEKRVRFS